MLGWQIAVTAAQRERVEACLSSLTGLTASSHTQFRKAAVYLAQQTIAAGTGRIPHACADCTSLSQGNKAREAQMSPNVSSTEI